MILSDFFLLVAIYTILFLRKLQLKCVTFININNIVVNLIMLENKLNFLCYSECN